MKTTDLTAELIAAQDALTAADRDTLRATGVPDSVIVFGLIGAAHVLLSDDGQTYQPTEHGPRLFITPVRAEPRTGDVESPDFELVPAFGALVDLIAWLPQFPGRWALRHGVADALGAIEPQYCLPAPVPVRRHPLSWLRSGGTGLCVLSRDRRDAYRLLSCCDRLEAEDAAHACELRSILERPFKTPPITVASSLMEAA